MVICFTGWSAAGAENTVGQVQVDAVQIVPNYALGRGEFTALCTFQYPGVCQLSDVALTRKNLMGTGRFSKVDSVLKPGKSGMTLEFQLTFSEYVKKISIKGADQISENRIIREIPIKKYGPFHADNVDETIVKIKAMYRDYECPIPEVKIKVEEVNKRGGVIIKINVTETPLVFPKHFFLRRAGDPGLFVFSKVMTSLYWQRFKMRLAGYNPGKFKALLERHQKWLRRQGYQNAELTLEEALQENSSVIADIDFNKKVDFNFKGAGFFTKRKILKQWRGRSHPVRDIEIERLARRTQKFLKQKGYLDATVDSGKVIHENKLEILILVDLGERVYVDSLEFIGGDSKKKLSRVADVHEPVILGLWKSYADPALLDEANDKIRDWYVSQGYPEAKVKHTVDRFGLKKATVSYEIEKGPLKTVSDIVFSGNNLFSGSELLLYSGLKVNSPYVAVTINNAMVKIRKKYWSRGYSDMSIQPKVEESGLDTYRLNVEIKEGPAYRTGPILVKGNYKTKTPIILDILPVVRDDPFDFIPLAETQLDLYKLNVFQSVTIRPVDSPELGKSIKTIVLDVKERSTGYFEFGLDVNTERGVELAGELGEKDLFGRALQASLSTLLGFQRQNLNFTLNQPFIFGEYLNNFLTFSYSTNLSNEGFDLTKYSVETGLSKEMSKRFRFALVYGYEQQVTSNVDSDIEDEIDVETGRVASLTPSASYDSRDNPFQPSKGFLASSHLKISNDLLGADYDFLKWESDFRWFYSLWEDLIFAVSFKAGRIWNLKKSNDIPLGERFFLGGANSDRGFREQKMGPQGEEASYLGGESFLLGNVEFRFPIWGNLSGGVFFDAGNVYLETPDSPLFRPAAGLGLRYKTPLGPLRGDFGFNLDPKAGEETFVFHIAIGHAF